MAGSNFSSDQMVVLKDGRNLSFLTSGSLDGIPLFVFHGTPGSRFATLPDDPFVARPDIFMIFPERPGYGLSSPKPDRKLTDWPDDVIELADHLGIDRFAVTGGSGGGPHTLVCAWKNPERVFAAFVFASPMPVESLAETKGMAFGNRLSYFLGTKIPWLVRYLTKSQSVAATKDPDKFLRAIAKQVSESDRAILEDEKYREVIIKDLREALRQGSDAQFVDGQIMMTMRPWGFSLSEIAVPVYAWHGELDALVPVSMAARYSDIPGAKVRIVPNAGHLLDTDKEVVVEFENALREEWQRDTSG